MDKETNVTPGFCERKNFMVIQPKIQNRHGFLRYTILDYSRALNYITRNARSVEEPVPDINKASKKKEKESDQKTQQKISEKDAYESLHNIILNLYNTFVLLSDGTDDTMDHAYEADSIIQLIQDAMGRLPRKKRETGFDKMQEALSIIIDQKEKGTITSDEFIQKVDTVTEAFEDEYKILLKTITNALVVLKYQPRKRRDTSEETKEIYRDMANTIELLLRQTTQTKSDVVEYQNMLIRKLSEDMDKEIIYKDERFNDINRKIKNTMEDLQHTVENQLIKPSCPELPKDLVTNQWILIGSMALNILLITSVIIIQLSKTPKGKNNSPITSTSLL